MTIGVAVIGAGMAGRAHAAAYRVAPTLYRSTLPDLRFVSIGDVALELHPQNLVFNPAGVRELVERTDATHLGVELDAVYWSTWLAALSAVDADMVVNI